MEGQVIFLMSRSFESRQKFKMFQWGLGGRSSYHVQAKSEI